jgi:RNA 2',3'-cyclic 3'-phosphodiesterase
VEKLRIFVAAPVPADRLGALGEALGPLQARIEGARWLAPDAQHVTLNFLGSIPADSLGEIEAAVAESAARAAPGWLAFDGLGAFPGRHRARVLWAGLADDTALLARLAAELSKRFAPLGFSSERRPFHPHLTLARFKTPARLDPAALETDLAPIGRWRLDRIELWRTHLGSGGARYEVLSRWPLALT